MTLIVELFGVLLAVFGGRDALKIIQVVVERIAVAMMYVAASRDGAVSELPYRTVEVARLLASGCPVVNPV